MNTACGFWWPKTSRSWPTWWPRGCAGTRWPWMSSTTARQPRSERTIRVRLTALYAGLFLATATILLVAVNLLLTNMLQVQVAGVDKNSKPPALGTGDPAVGTAIELRHHILRYQWLVTGIVIAVLTVVSVAVGWWLAG